MYTRNDENMRKKELLERQQIRIANNEENETEAKTWKKK